MNVLDLVRPEIRTMDMYSCASAETPGPVLRLDNNENPWPAPGLETGINRYPVQPPQELIRRMANYYDVDASNVLPTRGSDDAIDALVRCFCRPAEDAVITLPPTFAMYGILASIHGARIVEIPLDADFQPDSDVLRRQQENVKLLFLCSPNNPTGKAIPCETIASICGAWRGKAIVVVDEAYAEFMQQDSAIRLLSTFDNLAVLRTLSKGLALAGARVGALLAAPGLLACVRKVLPPYLLPTSSVTAAENVLADGALEIARTRIRKLLAERDILATSLESHPAIRRVLPSDANFLFVECVDPEKVYNTLLSGNVRVRAFKESRIRNYLRIGIGSPAENRTLRNLLGAGDVA